MVARYFIDTEFDGHGGPLLSLAMIREDGSSIYIRTFEEASDPWVIANVVPAMHYDWADVTMRIPINAVGNEILKHIGDDPQPVIIADSPVDIGRFCTALTTGRNGEWVSVEYPTICFQVHNVDCYPTDLLGAIQHNAWWDAMALRHVMLSKEGDA